MKLKNYINSKNISKILALGILLSSIPINSFASILSDNGRYETFEGDNITINDILEEDKVDVEIEGNTLVNIADSTQSNIPSEIKGWKINVDSNRVAIFYLKIDMLKPNTEYTIEFIGDMSQISESATTLQNVTENDNHVIGSSVYYSKYKYKITTNSLIHDSNKTQPIYLIPHIYPLEGEVFTQAQLDNLDLKVMVFEGDLTDKDTPDEYFFGIKSVGQGEKDVHKIEVLSGNKNLCPNNNHEQTFNVGEITNHQNGSVIAKDIKVKPNTQYYISSSDFKSGLDHIECITSNKPINALNHVDAYYKRIRELQVLNGTITTMSNEEYITLTTGNWLTTEETKTFYIKELQVQETSTKTSYTPYIVNKLEVLLNEPLRGLPNGIRDRIIKRNGQWVVERNCGETIYDGSNDEVWYASSLNNDINNNMLFLTPKNDLKPENTLNDKNTLISNILNALSPSQTNSSVQDIEGISGNTRYSEFRLNISKSKIGQANLNGLRQWLNNNPITIVYQLSTPIYEPLNIDLNTKLYLDTTHISTNSTIPANIKVIADRVANRAKECIELAKENPTIGNISLARMWINLMRESILKDEFQDNISNITEVSDMTLERKTVSANLDIYIKCENMLSMSLDTNSITFEDFSGISDIEKVNAVNININSSLPYNLNTYLASDIQSSDKSNSMDLDILSIKEGSELDYQKFSTINNKLILKSNCESGNNKQHNIDLKLNAGVAHEKDVYKTTIQFEAEQI